MDLLNGYRVVDLTDGRGLLAGRLLADLGAEVVQVEPPGGSSARSVGPFVGEGEAATSLYWEAFASNKRSVVLDADDPADRATLVALLATADFVFESAPPGWTAARGLDHDTVAASNPGVVYVSITPFGSDGPKADWLDSDLVCWAAGGALYFNRDGDRPPVRISVPQSYLHAAADAAVAALVAHHARVRDGLGQHVDVSVQQSVAQATLSATLSAAVADRSTYPDPGTTEARLAGQRIDLSGSGSASRRTKWPVQDGYVELHLSMGPAAGRFTNNLMRWLGEEEAVDPDLAALDWADVPRLYDAGELTIGDLERARHQVAEYLCRQTTSALMDEAMARKILLAPISTTADLVASPHLADRSFFAQVQRADAGTWTLPGPVARFDGVDDVARRRAPLPGEDQALVDGVRAHDWSGAARPGRSTRPDPAADGAVPAPTARPALDGLKVADLSWVVAGPMIGRVLADYGATVVRVESSWRIETNRLVGPFRNGEQDPEHSASYGNCNAGKLGVTLDLGTARGRDVVRDLVAWADVVLESFSPGVMAKWGLGFDELQRINPAVILLSTSLMGQTGRWATFAGFGNIGAAVSGFQHIVGWPDRPPLGPFGPYTDYVGPRFSLVALLAALDRRRRTGVGCAIDVAQAEAAIHFLGPQVAEVVATGVAATRQGNADRQFAPHGVYTCRPAERGRSRWVAVAVCSDDQWRALAGVVGGPELAGDPSFADAAARLERAGEIDERIGAWAAAHLAPDVAAQLQAAGVPAHVAMSSLDMLDDPQLAHRGHFVELDHPLFGRTTVEGSRFALSRTPAAVRRAAPTLGQDNETVLCDLLGYSAERYRSLLDGGILR